MNKLDQFSQLADEGKWNEALPIIEDIVRDNGNVSTSFYNYGVCLQELGRFTDAANAFKKCYELDPSDYNCQYRIFLNFSLANDVDGFFAFIDEEYTKAPEIIQLISESPEFTDMVSNSRFQQYIKLTE